MKNLIKSWASFTFVVLLFGQFDCEISNFIRNPLKIYNISSNGTPDAGSPLSIPVDDWSINMSHVIFNNQSQDVLRSSAQSEGKTTRKPNMVRKKSRLRSETIIPPLSSTTPSLDLKISTTLSQNASYNKSEKLNSSSPNTTWLTGKSTHYQKANDSNSDQTPPTNIIDTSCPPQLKTTDTQWRKGNSVVVSYLPRPINTDCLTNCKMPIIVHRSIYIQEGDAIKMLLTPAVIPSVSPATGFSGIQQADNPQLPATLATSPVTSSLPNSPGDEVTKSSIQSENPSTTNNSIPDDSSNRSQKNDQTISTERPILISSLTKWSKNSLIIWQVTEKEWQSCSTREGGQIAENGKNSAATIKSSFLIPGSTYLIGRSSWSSPECFKMKVTVRSADCGEGSICSGKGTCFANATMTKYECSCCHSYMGTHCQERNACSKQPCQNAGICIDIQEGHDGSSFQCICAYGFKGQLCDMASSLCTSNPCKNGGTCIGNHTSFSCLCSPGLDGAQCQNMSEGARTTTLSSTSGSNLKGACSDGECIHGICIQTSNTDFRCFCQPGYGGNKCEMEYNECFSQPCQNGGACMDNVGSFQCICESGFTGKFCEVREDLCDPNPCPPSRICVPGENSFTCECSSSLSPDGCIAEDHLCTPNPCANGGTCFIVSEVMTYYCVCRPGFTGSTCKGVTHTKMSPTADYPYLSRSSNQDKETSILESVGTYPTLEPVEAIDPQLFIPTTRTRMKSIYTAAITLSCAFLIVLFVITACHVRINGTMCRCFIPSFRRPFTPSFSRMKNTSNRDKRRKRLSSLRLDFDDSSSVPMTPQGLTETVYCNVDVCDSQDAPLMKQ